MYLTERLFKTEIVRKCAREVLLKNLDVVDKVLREELGIGSYEPQKDNRYTLFKYPDWALQEMVKQIEEYKREELRFSGYPVVAVEGIMHYYKDEIRRVLDASGLTSEEREKYILDPIINLIRTIHLLPATDGYHHTKLGGLLEHSLECAYHAAEIAKNEVWPTEETDHKSIYRSRWVTGAILSGLFHDIGKIATDVSIVDASGHETLNPYGWPLVDWAFEKIGPGNNYYVIWKTAEVSHDSMLGFMMMCNRGIRSETPMWLGNTVTKELGYSLCLPFKSRFKGIVIRANRESIRHDRKYTLFQDPQEENIDLIFEAIERMLSYGKEYLDENYEPKEFKIRYLKIRGWAVNTPTAAVIYHNRDHLFLFWNDFKQLAVENEILDLRNPFFSSFSCCLSDDQEDEFYAMTQELMSRGYLHSYGESKYWDVRRVNPETLEPYPEKLKAICFNEAGINKIFRSIKRPPVNGNLISISEKGFVNEPVGSKGTTTSEVNLSDGTVKESDKEVNQHSREALTKEQVDSFLPDFDSLLSKGLKPKDPERK